MEHQHIDMMITESMMPGMDGYALTEQLRDAGYDFPILMMTAKKTLKDKRKGFLVNESLVEYRCQSRFANQPMMLWIVNNSNPSENDSFIALLPYVKYIL